MIAVAVLLLGLFLIDSTAQRRRRRTRARRPTTPRITNPQIYQPAEETNSNNSTADPAASPETNDDPQTKTIRDLTSQVDKLTNKIGQMEESQRTLVDLERLSRAEQRSAELWKQLREVEAQQADLQARLEEIDYALKPENIDRSVAGYGSTRPEDVREQRRRQLEGDKLRAQKQLEQLNANHTRLETAIASADAEVDRLRKRLDAAEQAALENAKTKTQTEGAAPAPTPTPRP
jgi:septal ring factor EnvC (AmiA/AmiB activator)